MLYLFYGSDSININKKANIVLKSLLSKKPDANFFKLEGDNFNEELISELILSRGLFERKHIVFLDRIFEKEEIKDFILNKIEEIEKSENIFILAENEIDKKTLLKLEKYSEKIQEINNPKNEEIQKTRNQERKIIFSLTDAFGTRDKKETWIRYQKIVNKNISAEEIHGILFWQIKNMILASELKNAEEAGFNPFVYKKAKNFSKNFSKEELKKISADIVKIYHEARMGKLELGLATEKFLLEI